MEVCLCLPRALQKRAQNGLYAIVQFLSFYPRGDKMPTVLALDLGTATGWALSVDGRLTSGCWDLRATKRTGDRPRELALFHCLDRVRELHGVPDLVAVEDVSAHGRSGINQAKCICHGQTHRFRQQSTNVLAAQLFGAFRGVARLWCAYYSTPLTGVAVGTLKKFATGKGNATKEDMIAWARLRWPDQRVNDDNQADALHIIDWALVEVLKVRTKENVDARELEF